MARVRASVEDKGAPQEGGTKPDRAARQGASSPRREAGCVVILRSRLSNDGRALRIGRAATGGFERTSNREMKKGSATKWWGTPPAERQAVGVGWGCAVREILRVFSRCSPIALGRTLCLQQPAQSQVRAARARACSRRSDPPRHICFGLCLFLTLSVRRRYGGAPRVAEGSRTPGLPRRVGGAHEACDFARVAVATVTRAKRVVGAGHRVAHGSGVATGETP